MMASDTLRRIMSGAGPTLRAMERLLLPNACVSCGCAVERANPDALVCSRCRWRMKPLLGGCARCGQPFPPVGGCRVCSAWPHALAQARSAVWLGPEAREIVHRLKYDGLTALASLAADLVARHVRPPGDPGSALLIPVPLTPRRRRRRGYNQAELIARALSGRWGLPLAPRVLYRHRDAPSQTRLMAGARELNVTGAFLAVAPPGGRVPAVIIVDDVFTTGATIAAAAGALSSAGWGSISAVTFARALPFEARLG
jgi:ComF family protein